MQNRKPGGGHGGAGPGVTTRRAASGSRPPLAAAMALFALLFSSVTAAEDGYDLWLRSVALESAPEASVQSARHVYLPANASTILANAASELSRGLTAAFEREVRIDAAIRAGTVVLATPARLPLIDDKSGGP
jgi:alpha-glucuronidase